MTTRTLLFFTVLLTGALITGCETGILEPEPELNECRIPGSKCLNLGSEFEDVQKAFNEVKTGGTIEFIEGNYDLTGTITLNGKSNITIVGMGKNSTTLNFTVQESGNDGILISDAENIIVKNLKIKNTAGDGIKFLNVDGATVSDVQVYWDGAPRAENGGYGIYPIQSSNILIEDSHVSGSSDSGIYVGQSENAVIRNNSASFNVAGIEVENSANVDVYGNQVYENASGIMVFDLPGLSRYGENVRVFNNIIENNNYVNFAPGGSIVSQVPSGTGILVLSTKYVEIFDNQITGNNLIPVAVASYLTLVALGIEAPPTDPNYDPYPQFINIHDNLVDITGPYSDPALQPLFGQLMVQLFGTDPFHFVNDGFLFPGALPSGNYCMQDNYESSYVNLNVQDDFPNNLIFDAGPHNCSMDPLPEVSLKQTS